MLTDLEFVKAKLDEVGHAGFAAAHRGSGVPIRTIKRIAYDETKAPRSDNVGKLAVYFREMESEARRAACA